MATNVPGSIPNFSLILSRSELETQSGLNFEISTPDPPGINSAFVFAELVPNKTSTSCWIWNVTRSLSLAAMRHSNHTHVLKMRILKPPGKNALPQTRDSTEDHGDA